MKYLLDTNILVDHIRGKEVIHQVSTGDEAVISVITLAELIHGAYKSDNPKNSLSKVDYTLDKCNLQVENLSEDIVHTFGEIKANLEKNGQRLEDFDLLIAATALTNNLILVSRNIKHFKRIKGLELVS